MLALRRANLIHRSGLPRSTPVSLAAAATVVGTASVSSHHARPMALLHGAVPRSPASASRWSPATPTATPASPVIVSALAPHWRAFSTSILLRAAESDQKPAPPSSPSSSSTSPPPPGSTASPTSSSSNLPTTTTSPAPVPAPAPPKPFLRKLREDTWPHIKEEIAHYKEGSKLLAYEVKLSSRYLLKLMRGNKLSRREHRQLKRTVSDLFRLVPFAILVAIPFAELALPLLLKLFPNMLPSTFEKSFDKEEKKKKMLKMRLELAKFLQETVDEMAVTSADKQNATAALEFSGFFRKIRTTGEPPETDELIRVAQQFENELTLENLSRPQLVSMCKYMGINAFGTDNFLRFQVRNKMRQLHTDDQMIFFEGVESLSVYELQRACAERGIKTIGVSPARLRHDLQQWLDLHLIHKIPSSLLILSRAFIISDQPMLDSRRKGEVVEELPKTTAEALQATLQSLPPNLINEAELKLADQEGPGC
ncbi:LETM1-like protein-domain-containing protein [Catenaria anguillulae PL171]|uniref:LETM1-like protein-domain-containing protein n=1 Tax=Catenaria anguillulae PL171 TaxID=765915 RepID=A0A1Y2I3W1_9FUNG|nr:LETM1-like protein-domain-containing protein [Catenaria anguillulae PL171]